jgi:predicted transposase/invertase (TIGR01784 family)
MAPSSPHDEFFKEIFGDLDRARDFLRDTLPPEIRELLDLSKIQRETESFLSPQLAETYADLVFSCPLSGSKALVAILLEHKSWAPKHPHLQLLSYMLGIWERAESEGSLLPPVIPIVLYQGKERWTVRTLSQSFPGIPDRLRPFLPEFGFLLVDLARTSRETLRESYGNRSVLVAMELMKAIFAPAEVAALMERLTPEDGPMDTELAMRFLRVVLRYIFKRSDYGVQEALTLKLHPATREVTMTMEEQILKIGEDRGLERGLEQGLERGLRQTALENARKMVAEGCDWGFITRITGIQPEELAAA